MEETPKRWSLRTLVLNLAAVASFSFWVAKDLFSLFCCLVGIGTFYACVTTIQISNRAAEAQYQDERFDED
jgi:hypothetical protein